jgi:hypothetical protein
MRQSEIFQSKSFYPNKESHFVVDQRQLVKNNSPLSKCVYNHEWLTYLLLT